MRQLAILAIFYFLIYTACGHKSHGKARNQDVKHEEKHHGNHDVRHREHHLRNLHHPAVIHSRADNITKNNITNFLQNTTHPNGNLSFTFHYHFKIDIFNVTTKCGLTVDANASVLILYKEASNFCIAVNYTSMTGLYIDVKANASGQNWNNYFGNLPNLTGLFNHGVKNGSSFNVTNPSNISSELKPILTSFSNRYKCLTDLIPDVRRSACALTQLSKVVGTLSGNFHEDFRQLTQRLQAVRHLLGHIIGHALGINGSFNLENLNFASGIETFLALARAFGSRFNISELLQHGFNPEEFLSTIQSLGGGSNPLDLFLRVVSSFGGLGSGSFSPENFISTLLNFYGNSSNPFSSNQTILPRLQNLTSGDNLNILNMFLPGVGNIIQRLGQQNSSSNAALSSFLSGNSSSPISSIVQGLTSMNNCNQLGFERSIPILLARLYSLFSSSSGLSNLQRIIPNFNATQLGPISEIPNRIASSFQNFFLSGNAISNLPHFFLNNPLLGLISRPVNVALSTFTQGAYSLTRIFVTSGPVRVFLQAFLSFIRMGHGYFGGFISLVQEGLNFLDGLGNAFEQAAGSVVNGFGSGGSGNTNSSSNEEHHVNGSLNTSTNGGNGLNSILGSIFPGAKNVHHHAKAHHGKGKDRKDGSHHVEHKHH